MIFYIPNMELALPAFHFPIQRPWGLLQDVAQHIEAAPVRHPQLNAPDTMLRTASHQSL